MKVQVNQLSGIALDWIAASLCGATNLRRSDYSNKLVVDVPDWGRMGLDDFNYSSNWELAGVIIEKNNISLLRADDGYVVDKAGFTTNERIPQWFAECDGGTYGTNTSYEGEYYEPQFEILESSGVYGETPLIAAMRAYVMAKLGNEVEIPDVLLK